MTTLIKAIFFDLDGVLTTDSNGSGTVCRNIQKVVPNLSFDDLYRCYRFHHAHLLLSEAKHSTMWEDFCSCVGRELDINLLPEALATISINEPMLELCAALKGKYIIGIITDNSSERFTAIVERMKLDQIFDVLILSAHVGARKNEPLIFESALKAVNCTADECIFIDNQERNLSIPATMGFHTFLHDDTKNNLVPLHQWLQGYGIYVYS